MMKILQQKSGISLIFVLAMMLLLMAIGVSVITAASLNHGAGLAQRDRSQLALYVSGMERTICAALREGSADTPLLDAQTLGGLILKEAYLRGDGQHSINFPVTPGIPDEWDVTYTIEISAKMDIIIFPPIIETTWEEVWGAGLDGNPVIIDYIEVVVGRSPQLAKIDGQITVTQTAQYHLSDGKNLSMTTETTYQYIGAVIEERNYDELAPYVNNENMWIVEPGVVSR